MVGVGWESLLVNTKYGDQLHVTGFPNSDFPIFESKIKMIFAFMKILPKDSNEAVNQTWRSQGGWG